MGQQIKPGYCKTCDRKTKLEKERPNHILHLLLVLCTFGLWVPIWGLLGAFMGTWICSNCGSKRVRVIR